MFNYRPSKGNCWGHAMHTGNTLKTVQKMHNLFETYFEPVKVEKMSIILNRLGDTGNHVARIREKAAQVFGEPGIPESVNWLLAPNDYQKAVNFFLENYPTTKKPGDPIWFSFTASLAWKNSALPDIAWPEELLHPDAEKFRRWFLIANLQKRGRFMFPMGLSIPISISEQASYDFLAEFSAAAPFKMSPGNFQVLVPVGGKGKTALRKPDPEIAARLEDALKNTQ